MEKRKRREIDLTQGRISTQMIHFFIPIFCGIFFQQIYITADAIIIGKVISSDALAAVGCTGAFLNLLIGFFMGIGSGATVVIAQYFGAHEYDQVRKATHTALVLAASLGLAFTVIGFLISPWLLTILKTPAAVFDMSVQYLQVYFFGMLPSMLYNMGSGILRAVGDAKRPVYILITTAIINIILDLLFTAGLQMGVRGAALATVLSQFLAMFLVLLCMYREKDLPVQLHFRELKPDGRLLLRIIRIGLPTGLQSTMFDLSNLLIQASVNLLGPNTMAAWTAYTNISLIFWMTISAMGTTVTTFAGQNFGAAKLDRLHQGIKTGMLLATGVCFIISVFSVVFRYPLSRLFLDDPEIVATCMHMLLFLSPTYILYMFIEIYSGMIRGVGEALIPMIITGLSICVFRVFWVLVVLPFNGSLDMICLSYPISWALGSFAFFLYYKKGTWLTKRLSPAQREELAASKNTR